MGCGGEDDDPGSWDTGITSSCGQLSLSLVSLVWLLVATLWTVLRRGFLHGGANRLGRAVPRLSQEVAVGSCAALWVINVTMLVMGCLNHRGWLSKDINWALSVVSERVSDRPCGRAFMRLAGRLHSHTLGSYTHPLPPGVVRSAGPFACASSVRRDGEWKLETSEAIRCTRHVTFLCHHRVRSARDR